MTPKEYLQADKTWFRTIRFCLFHTFPLLIGARHKRTQPFREAPTWAIATMATARHKMGEHTAERSMIETAAFYAEKEFARRMFSSIEGCTK